MSKQRQPQVSLAPSAQRSAPALPPPGAQDPLGNSARVASLELDASPLGDLFETCSLFRQDQYGMYAQTDLSDEATTCDSETGLSLDDSEVGLADMLLLTPELESLRISIHEQAQWGISELKLGTTLASKAAGALKEAFNAEALKHVAAVTGTAHSFVKFLAHGDAVFQGEGHAVDAIEGVTSLFRATVQGVAGLASFYQTYGPNPAVIAAGTEATIQAAALREATLTLKLAGSLMGGVASLLATVQSARAAWAADTLGARVGHGMKAAGNAATAASAVQQFHATSTALSQGAAAGTATAGAAAGATPGAAMGVVGLNLVLWGIAVIKADECVRLARDVRIARAVATTFVPIIEEVNALVTLYNGATAALTACNRRILEELVALVQEHLESIAALATRMHDDAPEQAGAILDAMGPRSTTPEGTLLGAVQVHGVVDQLRDSFEAWVVEL